MITDVSAEVEPCISRLQGTSVEPTDAVTFMSDNVVGNQILARFQFAAESTRMIADVSEVRTASVIRAMTRQRCIPKGTHLQPDLLRSVTPLMLQGVCLYCIIKNLRWMSRAVGYLYNLVSLVAGFQISRVVEKPFCSTMATVSVLPCEPKANVIQSTVFPYV
jgi:hypothetical protein